MRILGFDTATDDTVVAALDAGRVVFERRTDADLDGRPRHNEVLLASIEEAVAGLGGWSRVDRIAVGVGPGTFTGIRIGISTAMGFALSTGVSLAGVSTLATLAVGIASGLPGGGSVVPVLDARRGEVFTGLYDEQGGELGPPVVESPAELINRIGEISQRLPGPLKLGGLGSIRFRDQLERAGLAVPDPESEIHRISGRALCELGAGVPPVETEKPLKPIYLRAPDAQLWLERDHHPPASD